MRYHFEQGSATSYDADHKGLMMHQLLHEVPTHGKGDYREPQLLIELSDGTTTLDLTYVSHRMEPNLSFPGMPQFTKQETLVVTLEDPIAKVRVESCYTTLDEENVLLRNLILTNQGDDPIVLDRALSASLDLPNEDYSLLKLDGAWIRERHIQEVVLTYGTVRFDSKKGVSSADHNPFFVLKRPHTTNDHGRAYGMALVYSGNFEANIELQTHDLLRANLGINSFLFRHVLPSGESFVTPEVALVTTDDGLDDLSKNFHQAIVHHLIPPAHRDTPRPIVINNWEATYFDFNEKQLLAIAKLAKQLGMELFCLDDGWFANRNDDFRSLGDWHHNPRKLKRGLRAFKDKLARIGLRFGLWVEPEMVNQDSDLYRDHPDWAIAIPGRTPALGRNQLILDLTNPAVRDHLKTTLVTLVQEARVDYVKWDMNRNFSDVYSAHLDAASMGSFHHRYVMGLYDVLEHLRTTLPEVLFEGCASGGNRFDLGMLYYMPQIWTSDDTDAYERIRIQEGTSLLYPLSSISNHVSGDRSHQVFRHTPLESRFHVACFGVLGYEMDLRQLTPFDRKTIARQIAFYKEHRMLFQYGTFRRLASDRDGNTTIWMVQNDDATEALVLYFQRLARPNPVMERIRIPDLAPGRYLVRNRVQHINVRTFGTLVNEALPIKLKVNHALHNAVANRYLYRSEAMEQTVTADQLAHVGLLLPHRFTGTGHGEHDRVVEDFGTRIYHVKKIMG
jgi:alpha-galactosidase